MSGVYEAWPALTELFPTSFPGIKTGRDALLVDIDRERLQQRMEHYFDPAISHTKIAKSFPTAMEDTKQFQSVTVREQLQKRGLLPENIVRYCYRPFDMRWLYWEPETTLLAQNRPNYTRQPFTNNLWIEARQKSGAIFDRGYVVHTLADHFGNGTSRFFPLFLNPEHKQFSYFETDDENLRPNLSVKAMVYAKDLDVTAPNLFYHLITILHTPTYREEQQEHLEQGWAHLPLPRDKELLRQSALLGQRLAMLLNPEIKVKDVTAGLIRADLKTIAALSYNEDVSYPDLTLLAEWGRLGRRPQPLLGPGEAVEREYTAEERVALEKGGATAGLTIDQLYACLGRTTFDIYLNETTFWANIPHHVWHYTASGYSVLHKWLSYRGRAILGRPLQREEGIEFTNIARRITSILLMKQALNTNYKAIKQSTYDWPKAE